MTAKKKLEKWIGKSKIEVANVTGVKRENV